MALLDGFKVIPLKEKLEDSILTITSKSIKLNRATSRLLDTPILVQFLINEKRMQIALTPAKVGDENGVDFTFPPEGREKPIVVKEPAVLKAIGKLAVLEKNETNLMLTIKGVVYPAEKTIIYDLGEAVETIVKPRGRKRKET
jgi:hypothetical protein